MASDVARGRARVREDATITTEIIFEDETLQPN